MMTIANDGYTARHVDCLVEQYLNAFGAVEIVGSKWCGKTWTSRAHANSEINLDDRRTRELVQADNSLAFAGDLPHLIDEWQLVPDLWDATRRQVDLLGKRGLYILTGSSEPTKDSVTHSGTGRIARMHMRPMTLSESGHSNSTVSFSGLFTHDYDFKASPVKTDLHNIATYICRGGWPGAIDLDDNTAMRIPAQYIDTMLSSGASNKNRTQYMTRLLLKSLARNLGKAVKKKTLLADLQHGAVDKESTVTRPTLEKLLDSLIDQFLIEEVFGWDAPVKSKSRVRISPVRSFVDPSIPASLLGMSPERLLMDMQTFGNLFEELCLRDIRVYASVMNDALPNPVLQYRDSDNLEVDVIVELRDGRWAALEIKLSENKVDAGIKNLTRLKEKVASNPLARTSAPSFMAVIVGKTDYCRRTQDGIYVIPITELTA